MSLNFLKFGRVQDRGTLKCPFCRDPIFPAPTVVRCFKCKTVHHEKCWEERGNCSVYGCRGTPQQEITETFYIELFQKRRKKLLRSWFTALITAVIITFILFFVLKPVLPWEGRMVFAGSVVMFLIVVIYLNGYAQYLCPGCGRQPRSVTDLRQTKTVYRVLGFWLYTYQLGPQASLMLNPSECPHCHIRLR